MKRFFLFLLFPEVGFRKEVQAKKISRGKLIYAVSINFVLPLLFLIVGLIINANQPLKERIQALQDTDVSEVVDDYGRYASIPFIFLLDRVGMPARTPFVLRALTFTSAYIIGDAVVYRTKQFTQVTRPKQEYGNTS
ncbi:MAG TPA: hypothetical protein PLJ40_03910, partial [Paludibacteraceae bacterium]|nr:hypothetical protein [Paludibacteraceae bacterium]HQB69403.1 hypothetical protein [Paludibacteraceae bacterium]